MSAFKTKIAFDVWWQEFLRDPRWDRDPYGALDYLQLYVRRLRADERDRFVDELLEIALQRRDGYALAYEIIESEGRAPQLDAIAAAATALLRKGEIGRDDEVRLTYLVRALTAESARKHSGTVRAYLLDRQIDAQWAKVPWSLWPRERELFACAWSRYFIEIPSARWKDSVIVQSLFDHLDALESVSCCLYDQSRQGWRAWCVAVMQCASNLSIDERKRVQVTLKVTDEE